MSRIDRRSLLQGGGALALTAAAATVHAQPKISNKAIKVQLSPVLRRSVNTMALNDPMLEAYRKAVAKMRTLPATDKRSWEFQAQIHNNHCPHGNWFFLPWHRAYLLAFEHICREFSGKPDFALPYWDWTGNPQLPAAFATQDYNGQPNPLFDANRSSQSVTISSTYVGAMKMSQIYAETSFEVFGSTRPTGQNSTAASWQRANGLKGPFESGPHDHVHTTINGDMMQLISPRDPIFWLHHCNIDRIWDHWNSLGRANTSDNLWRTFAFNGQFFNPSGANGTTAYNTTVAAVLDILSLGYRYTLPRFNVAVTVALLNKFINPGDPVERIPLTWGAAAKINVATVAQGKLAPPQKIKFTNAIESFQRLNLTATVAKQAQASSRIMLFIRNAEKPAEGNVDVRVFVNHPNPTADTSVRDRHYAGSFTFFGAGHDHADHGANPSYMLDITDTVSNLQIAGIDLTKDINVQLVPVPIPGEKTASEVKVGSIEVAIF